jgi:hypothetical protein
MVVSLIACLIGRRLRSILLRQGTRAICGGRRYLFRDFSPDSEYRARDERNSRGSKSLVTAHRLGWRSRWNNMRDTPEGIWKRRHWRVTVKAPAELEP